MPSIDCRIEGILQKTRRMHSAQQENSRRAWETAALTKTAKSGGDPRHPPPSGRGRTLQSRMDSLNRSPLYPPSTTDDNFDDRSDSTGTVAREKSKEERQREEARQRELEGTQILNGFFAAPRAPHKIKQKKPHVVPAVTRTMLSEFDKEKHRQRSPPQSRPPPQQERHSDRDKLSLYNMNRPAIKSLEIVPDETSSGPNKQFFVEGGWDLERMLSGVINVETKKALKEGKVGWESPITISYVKIMGA